MKDSPTDKSVSQICQSTDKSVRNLSNTQQAQARSLLKLKQKEQDLITAFDFDELTVMLAGGMTYTEAARRVGVGQAAMSAWIANQHGTPKGDALAAARRASAPACFDRALEALENANTDSTGAVTTAVNTAKHFEKRGALADRMNYHDRPTVLDVPQVAQAAPSFRINIISNGAPQTVTIDQQPDDDTSLI